MATQSESATLLEMLKQLREDFAQERSARQADNEAARQSRATQYERMDEVIDRLGRIDTTVALAGQVDAQVRVELDALKKSIADISPTVDEWRRIRSLGLGIVGLMTAGGVTIGAALQWGGDGLVTMIRNWLHIH